MRDELIKGLSAGAGEVTIFVSTHDLAEVESFATHLGYLERGRLLFSEQLATLSGRFRQVDILIDQPASPGASWPVTWMQVDPSDERVRFVDSEFDATLTPQRIRSELQHVREISFTPMSLRSIFIAVARSEAARQSQ